MEIKTIKEIKTSTMPQLYCSPLAPLETDEEATRWAARRGAKVLYKYERHGKWTYLVEVHP